MKRIKYIFLSCMMLAATFCTAGCKEEPQELLKRADVPDYSAYTDQFDFYGYSSAYDGTYTIDDVKYSVGESFLTKEQYQMYKDAGMTIFYPQSVLKINSDRTNGADRKADWEKVKTELDKLEEVGITKTLLYDEEISWLSLGYNLTQSNPLIGEGAMFATEEALDERVNEIVSLYAGDDRIYGVLLADEPRVCNAIEYGQVYQSIQRVNKKYGYNLYVSYNLNPLNLASDVYNLFYPETEGTENIGSNENPSFEDGFIRYKDYLNQFLEAMNPSYIRYDDYPLRDGYLKDTYIPCLTYVADLARDKNIDFRMVTQTFGMYTNGTLSTRKLTENGAKWLNNMLIGFGVKDISYFTYYTRPENRTDGESFIEDQSFVTLYGKKTKIYDFMQGIMADNQRFAPTVLQFKYKKSGVFGNPPYNSNANDFLKHVDINVQTYDKLQSVSINKECAMVNELYDAENGRYMYMAMNIVDPDYLGSNYYQTITLQFAPEYKYALVYRDGEKSLYRLENSKLKVKGAPGEASFVIPF